MEPVGCRRVGVAVPWAWGLGLAVVAAALWAGLGSGAGVLPWQDGSLQRVRRDGELRVGYSVEPPYAQLGSDGTVTGAFPEVMRHLARQQELGRITWVQVPFDALIPALLERRIDVAAAGMFVTPQRSERVRFSRPVVLVRPGWLTAPGNPRSLARYDALPGSGDAKAAVLQGSQEQALLTSLGLLPPRLQVVPDARTGQALVRAGRVDGLALSWPTVQRMAADSPDEFTAVTAGAQPSLQQAALALHPDDRTLAEALDEALAASRTQPAFLATLQAFGFGPDDLPPLRRDPP